MCQLMLFICLTPCPFSQLLIVLDQDYILVICSYCCHLLGAFCCPEQAYQARDSNQHSAPMSPLVMRSLSCILPFAWAKYPQPMPECNMVVTACIHICMVYVRCVERGENMLKTKNTVFVLLLIHPFYYLWTAHLLVNICQT